MDINNQDKNIVAIYCRLSKEDRDKNKGDDSRSIQNQRDMLMSYAKDENFEIYNVYIDDDYSGLYDDRPAFERLIKDAENHKFNIVIAKSQSRFSRSSEHANKYIHKVFKELGIRFIGTTDHIDTANESTKKNSQISGLTNEWYCEDLSNNVRNGNYAMMKKGKFIGSFTCFGYLKDPEDKYHRIIDPYASEVVKKIFELYVSGCGANEICKKLKEEDIPTPLVYKKYYQKLTYQGRQTFRFCEKYNLWNVSTVLKILKDETYIGNTVQHKTEKVAYNLKKRRPLPRKEWIIVKNTHEPIIEEELFHRVQKITKMRIKAQNTENHSYIPQNLFAGRIFCADCGNKMINCGKTSAGNIILRCHLARRSRQVECSSHTILLKVLNEYVGNEIKKLIDTILNTSEAEEEIGKLFVGINSKEDDIKILKKKIDIIQSKKKKSVSAVKTLYMDRVSGNIEEQMFMELKKNFEESNIALQKESESLTEKLMLLEQEEEKKINLVEMVNKYYNYSELSFELIDDFIDKIEIGEKDEEGKQKVSIYWDF